MTLFMANSYSVICRPLPIHGNQHFTVELCGTCGVPGYLIVAPRVPVGSLSELAPDALTALGPTLAFATRAIETVIQPERVYCALFAEQAHHVHFHLFPRTAELARQFLASHSGHTEISGPHLMDWARRVFRQPLTGNDQIAENIRAFCKNHDPNIHKP